MTRSCIMCGAGGRLFLDPVVNTGFTVLCVGCASGRLATAQLYAVRRGKLAVTTNEIPSEHRRQHG